MQGKIKSLLEKALMIGSYVLLVYFSISIGILWASISLITLWTAVLVGILYRDYYYEHSNKKKKQRMNLQRSTINYYDNIWYRPADSTEIDYQRKKLQTKKRSRRK